MDSQSYRPINTACIHPASFPKVALYMLSGSNYVLYNPADRPLNSFDMERLARNQVKFLYISAFDMQEVADFLENTLDYFMSQEGVDPKVRGQVLHQVAMNYVMDIFSTPDKLSDLERCRNLVRQLMMYITSNQNALDSLHAIVQHDYYTYIHSVHVASLSMLVHAKIFGLAWDELEDVGVGGILHDVGMIFIPSSILEKPDILTNFEYNLIKRHAQRGYECLKELGGLSNISLAAVRFHHERYNGEGYPFKLEGDEIPRTAQVTAICDVYSALVSNRPYRSAADPKDALELMGSVGERVFNPALLKHFKEIVMDSGSIS
jgi:HD-GYP domain-containing protein (c-di-GMP phosphodiesterase class II)